MKRTPGRPRTPVSTEDAALVRVLATKLKHKEIGLLMGMGEGKVGRIARGEEGEGEEYGQWTRETTREVLRRLEGVEETEYNRAYLHRIWGRVGPIAMGMWK